ncbi:MAG: methyltransferase domain-containing protein [Thermodesulfobacteriota bacterium]|jgi:ubiquinone/menaquinone biosynthesis C-methylase UbiE
MSHDTPYYKQHWIDIDEGRFAAYDLLLQYHPRMEPLIAPLDLRPGLSVLDVGSGPGYMALELGRRVGAGGSVTGVDINATFVSKATERAREHGLPQVRFQHAAFPPLPFADRAFDRAFCKNVLEYVDSAEETLQEIARVTRPGGKVVLIDSDWDMLALDVTDEALHDRILHAVKTTATREPRIGRKLYRLCRAAGLQDISVRIFASPDLDGWALPMLEHSLYQYATVSGEVNQHEADAWLGDVKRRAQRREYFFCLPQFVVSATK